MRALIHIRHTYTHGCRRNCLGKVEAKSVARRFPRNTLQKGRFVKRSAGKAETTSVSGFSSPWTAGYVHPTVLSFSVFLYFSSVTVDPSRSRLFLASVLPRRTPVLCRALLLHRFALLGSSAALRFVLCRHIRVGRALAEVVRSCRWKFPRLAISV